MKLRCQTGFTLIELLIVVAIIAILAAIALPNFQEAQTRSRYSRVRSDMRTIATGLEAYAVDANHYPESPSSFSPSYQDRLKPLTSPIAYLTKLPADPFKRDPKLSSWRGAPAPTDPADMYGYNTDNNKHGAGFGRNHLQWSLTSGGPDGKINFPYYAFDKQYIDNLYYIDLIYDPTNGTTSNGDIFLRGGNVPNSVNLSR